jgi:ribA/ribD-fused uncharacterized protein
VIAEFKGEYRFLSNFYMAPVTVGLITYPSAEHAFQAGKASRPAEAQAIAHLRTAAEAKRAGRALARPANWEQVRKQRMLKVVLAKFSQDAGLGSRLIATGAEVLTEGNGWHDDFWGVCRSPGPHPAECAGAGQGSNYLGQILMAVRMVLKPD